MSSEENWIITL